MENDKIIKIAATGFIGLVMVPAVVGLSINLIGHAANGISHLAYKRKIKKGLKDGSVIEINGQYYEVNVKE